MPEEQFWYGNPQDFYVFSDAYELEQKRIDYHLWLNNLYGLTAHRQALSECLSKNAKKIYPERPFSEENEIKKVARNDLQERIYKGLMNAKIRYKE